MKRIAIACLVLASLSAFAELPPQFTSLPGWVQTDFPPADAAGPLAALGAFETNLCQGGVGSLDYGAAQISVCIRKLSTVVPKGYVLGSDTLAWHKLLFKNPQSVRVVRDPQTGKPNEGTVNIEGQWRYSVVFQTDAGTGLKKTPSEAASGLKTAMTVLILNGQLYTLTYEMPDPLFSDRVAVVQQMFRSIEPH